MLHQSEPGDVVIGRASGSSLSMGPSLELETGVAAEGRPGEQTLPWALIVIGLLMVVLAGGFFAYEVSQHVTENAVLAGPTDASPEASEAKNDPSSTIALLVALLGVVPLMTGVTMLRGRRRRRRQQLTVYDGWTQPRDYRKRAPIWLGLGLVLTLGGGGLFAYEVGQHDPGASITEVKRGDMEAFKNAEDQGTGGIGLAIGLLGLVPLVIGFMGLQEAPVKPRRRKPKGGHAPREHKLFEWVEREGAYYIDLPPETRGKLALGKNRASVDQLRKRYGQGDRLRIKLGPKVKGKLLIGQTKIIFQTAKPARAAARRPFPVEYVDPLTHLRPSSLDASSFGAVAGVAVLLGVWFAYFADRTPPPPAERFVREMGMPASFYEEEEEEEPEETEEKDALEQKDEKEEKEEKEDEPEEDKLDKPENVSEKAFQEARGVGVARVLGTYGGPGEGSVLDVIENTENNLGEMFALGMSSTEEYRGGEIGDFVAGGGGIESTGTMAKNAGLETGTGPAEVGATKKKERKVKAKSSTGDVVGDVDKKSVSATIRRRMPGLEACYEKALRSNSSLSGKMTYTITINPSGRVSDVDIEVDTVGDASVRSCTTAKIKGWRFLSEGAEDSSEVTFSVAFTG
ncbi:AgmX/PglI C-terminal domain-containing protein [Enhygromyxa salina]|uniref:AgmX/PglI C-terminal domain-containing protein n=1 Tax=Enhygromyxa salina TaxID=215803 RepID=UPI0011B263D9|nr:AgmX/PglI C-terminal domain-containing protein [Enhygromyxa salina]